MKLCKPLRATTKWLRHAVAGKLYTRPLCPFASKPLRSELIRLVSCDSECEEQLMSLLKQELNCLFPVTRQSSETSPATTLVVAPNLFHNNYRAMVHFSWRIMEYISTQAAYAEQVQVVNFHPKAVRSLYQQGAGDGSEYSIRSPYPTFHLLKESDVLEAVTDSGYPDPEQIPSRNAAILRKIGPAECYRRFNSLIAK